MPSRNPRFRRTALASAAATFCLLPVWSGAEVPLGREFRVNTYTFSTQDRVEVAADAAGNFVVVWEGNDVGEDGSGVRAQRFNASGVALGGEIRVNTTTTGQQSFADVAMDADGDFIIVWSSFDQEAAGSSWGVYGQRFSAAGVSQGSEFAVNTYITGSQVLAKVACDAAGNFVVVWQGDAQPADALQGVYAQRYSADGNRLGGELLVNTYTTSNQSGPSIDVDADGDFVVVWSSYGPDGDRTGVYAQRYFSSGTRRGTEFRVNTTTANDQNSAAVALSAGGGFVVAWTSSRQDDGNQGGVYQQRYAVDGSPQGGETLVNQYTTNSQFNLDVAADALGRYVVTWVSNAQDGSLRGVYARRFDADGTPLDNEFPVNTYTSLDQDSPSAAMDADGDLVIVWESPGDGSGDGAFARRYQGIEPVDVAVWQADSADPAAFGEALSYTLVAGNRNAPVQSTGVDALDAAIGAASSLRVIDLLPDNVGNVSVSGSGWSCTLPVGRVVCDYTAPLPPDTEAPPLTLTLSPLGTTARVLSNVARVSAGQPEPDATNNRAVERTRLDCAPSQVEFSAAVYPAPEDSGSANVTVRRSGGDCGEVRVQVDSSSLSATAGTDFTDVGGTLVWADGDLADKSFLVPIGNDLLDEHNERIVLSLGGISGATLGPQRSARIVIEDDDASPRINFTATAQTVPESPALVTVTARLAVLSGREVSVPLSFGGTATSGGDYFPGATGLVIPAGSLQATVDIEIAGDTATESNETVVVGMGAVSGTTVGSIRNHTVTITDDDAASPTVSFTTASSSGDEATPRGAVLTLSAPSAQAITVPFTITGTATQGSDYTLNRTTPITFNPGVTQLGIQILPVDDAIEEPSESVILSLGTPTGATLGSITVHTRSITDNDP